MLREPTEEMTEAACNARAGCGAKNWPSDFTQDEREQWRHEAREQLMAAAELALPQDNIPAFHGPTCGTAYLTAERALRIIERATARGNSIDCDAIDHITNLCDEAGIQFAKMELRKGSFDDPTIPF